MGKEEGSGVREQIGEEGREERKEEDKRCGGRGGTVVGGGPQFSYAKRF